jgi:hypothetical protein
MSAPRLDANSWDTQICIEVEQDGYSQSAAAVKAELKRLEKELQQADASGDRSQALNILSRMLDLQRRFMDRWPNGGRPATPIPVTDGRGSGGQVSDEDNGAAFRSPGRSGRNPDNV